MKTNIDYKKARLIMSQCVKNLNWLQRTGRLSKTLIPDYEQFETQFDYLRDVLKIDFEGNIKKKDKRGAWR